MFLWADANGQSHLVKGPVPPRDVWIDNKFRYLVKFNEYNQPLGKGGSILVRFLGDVAKRESFCPVGYKRWHMLKKTMKADVIDIVRVCLSIRLYFPTKHTYTHSAPSRRTINYELAFFMRMYYEYHYIPTSTHHYRNVYEYNYIIIEMYYLIETCLTKSIYFV